MKKPNAFGFTLIEMILALTIFSVVSLSVYAAFSVGIRLSKHSEENQDVLRDARWTFDLISRELENSVAYDTSGSSPEKVTFKGENHKLTFLTSVDGRLKVVTYALSEPEMAEIFKTVIGQTYKKNVDIVTRYEESFEVEYLTRKSMDLADFLADTNEPEEEVLSTNVSPNGLRFSYGYKEREGTGATSSITWKSNWESQDIPVYVKVEMDFLPAAPGQEKFSLTSLVTIPHGFLGQL